MGEKERERERESLLVYWISVQIWVTHLTIFNSSTCLCEMKRICHVVDQFLIVCCVAITNIELCICA